MPTCRGCDRDIEVKFVAPQGAQSPILENLCPVCLSWVDVAKGDEYLLPPTARRKPREYPENGEEEV
jgi:hypothetical protein